MDGGDNNSARRPNFSHEETEVLLREVQARNGRIYGYLNQPPQPEDAKRAWVEVTSMVNLVCPNIQRTVAQCRKRLNDVRRRNKLKLSQQKAQMVPAGGGPSTSVAMRAEDIASTSLPAISIESFGGIEVCITDPLAIKKEEEEGRDIGTEEVGDPGTEDGQRLAHVENQNQNQPVVDIQRGGFGLVEQELGTINSRLLGLETRLLGLEAHLVSLSSIDASLKRLADAAERLVATQETPAPHCPSRVSDRPADKRRAALHRLPSPNREHRASTRTRRKEY